MDKKRIILLCAMGLLLAAAIALGLAWVIEANEYAGYEADYVDIAEDVLRPDDDIVIIELAPPSPTPEQSATPEEVAEPDISTDIYAHHVCALYERTRSRCGQQ